MEMSFEIDGTIYTVVADDPIVGLELAQALAAENAGA